MPRSAKPKESPEKLAQNGLVWAMMGTKEKVPVTSWDPKQVQLVQAFLEVLASGCTVVLRPGKGGQSVGVAIWEKFAQGDPEWCNTSDELDAWADGILTAAEVMRLRNGG